MRKDPSILETSSVKDEPSKNAAGNAFLSTETGVPVNTTYSRSVQSLKASCWTETPPGILTSSIPEHPLKADAPIPLTESGMTTTPVNPVQPWKAPCPTVTTVDGRFSLPVSPDCWSKA